MFRHWFAFALCIVTAACRTGAPDPVRSPSPFPAWNDLSFSGFAQEVLVGYGTQRTPRFDDYTKGSYHVDPAQLVKDLPAEARLYKLNLQAVVVVGPYGLWAYDVIAVLRDPDEDCVRVNWLGMPHARITHKRSGCLSVETTDAWLAEMKTVAPVVSEPSSGQQPPCVIARQFTRGIITASESAFGCHSKDTDEDLEKLSRWMNQLYPKLQMTYSGYPVR